MAQSQTITAAAAQRARIVLMAAEGVPNAEIARRIGVSRPTVVGWRSRYQERGIAGLADEDRPGRPPGSSLGVTHWSSRLLARELGVSFASVARIWRTLSSPTGAGRAGVGSPPRWLPHPLMVSPSEGPPPRRKRRRGGWECRAWPSPYAC